MRRPVLPGQRRGAGTPPAPALVGTRGRGAAGVEQASSSNGHRASPGVPLRVPRLLIQGTGIPGEQQRGTEWFQNPARRC